MLPESSTSGVVHSEEIHLFSGQPDTDLADLSTLEAAILKTVAYVDMYDYPLTAKEIHRYLIVVPATQSEVDRTLNESQFIKGRLEQVGDFYTLPGRGQIVDIRRQRATASNQLWPHAYYYGRLAATLPFVSMVAVTGSLAVNNVDDRADIDYFIITEPGRLWLCRAMVILLVRMAARRGVYLCPNYFISERALAFPERDLYTAHEITQMVLVAGKKVYQQLREANRWVADFLPNSDTAPRQLNRPAREISRFVWGASRLGEVVLRTPPGTWLERWEMNRKVRRFTEQMSSESSFSADWCKGHFDAHGQRTMDEFVNQLKKLKEQNDRQNTN